MLSSNYTANFAVNKTLGFLLLISSNVMMHLTKIKSITSALLKSSCFLDMPVIRKHLSKKMDQVTWLSGQYVIPKIKMLCNLHRLKARLRLLCNKYQRHSSLNLISQQLKLHNIFTGNATLFYDVAGTAKPERCMCSQGQFLQQNRWDKVC